MSKPREEITIKVCWSENDDGTINIDEDTMRDEFDEKVRSIVEEVD